MKTQVYISKCFSESIQSEYQQFSFCPWDLHWIYFRTVFIILLGIGFVEEHSKGILTCLGVIFSMFSLTCFKLMRRLYSGGQRNDFLPSTAKSTDSRV